MSDRLADLAHPLFAGTPVDKALDSHRNKALAEVDAVRSDDLLTGDLPGLRRHLVETYRIDPLRIEWDARTALASDDRSTVRVFVPFLGAAGLFDMRPTRDDGEHPIGWVREHELVLVLAADGGKAQREVDRQKSLINDWAARINSDVEPRNERLARTIRTRVTFEADRVRRTAALALELGPPPAPRTGRRSEERQARSTTSGGRSDAALQAHRPGRPRASRELILDRYEEAVAATPQPQTLTAIAARFRTMDGRHLGISARHLRRLLGSIQESAE